MKKRIDQMNKNKINRLQKIPPYPYSLMEQLNHLKKGRCGDYGQVFWIRSSDSLAGFILT